MTDDRCPSCGVFSARDPRDEPSAGDVLRVVDDKNGSAMVAVVEKRDNAGTDRDMVHAACNVGGYTAGLVYPIEAWRKAMYRACILWES